ncbi:hypothetical protein IMZ48_44440 [Candidatus Bathyarchaeota archaeon]|nr:hypothetical protein [Candidatus Bathyarchaeota archaeon]
MSYLVKSVAWPGVDIKTLEEYFLLRATYYGGTTTDYYAYLLDGKTIMQQIGTEGHYSRIDDELYEKLVKLAQSSISTVGGVEGQSMSPQALTVLTLTPASPTQFLPPTPINIITAILLPKPIRFSRPWKTTARPRSMQWRSI